MIPFPSPRWQSPGSFWVKLRQSSHRWWHLLKPQRLCGSQLSISASIGRISTPRPVSREKVQSLILSKYLYLLQCRSGRYQLLHSSSFESLSPISPVQGLRYDGDAHSAATTPAVLLPSNVHVRLTSLRFLSCAHLRADLIASQTTRLLCLSTSCASR